MSNFSGNVLRNNVFFFLKFDRGTVSESGDQFSVFFSVAVEQAWCGIYGMAPTIQAQHVVAVTIPTIALIYLTYLWYKKRSNSVTRGRNDPGGGGGTSRKRTRHRNTTSTTTMATSTMPVVAVPSTCNVDPELFPEAMKNAMQKAIRDLETASPIQEICSDAEENLHDGAENGMPDVLPIMTADLEVTAVSKSYTLEVSSRWSLILENLIGRCGEGGLKLDSFFPQGRTVPLPRATPF